MSSYGFIHDKLDIKLLILYITARMVGPAPFEMLQDLAMCDGGVSYFDFSECLADLVRTEHLSIDSEGLYRITEKGRRNGSYGESGLPYAVRLRVEENLSASNEQIKRRALIGAEIQPQEKGGYRVTLTFRDELDELMKLSMFMPREDIAKSVQRRFRQQPEQIYAQILKILYQTDD